MSELLVAREDPGQGSVRLVTVIRARRDRNHRGRWPDDRLRWAFFV